MLIFRQKRGDMMTLGKRIKLIRNKLNMTMEVFGNGIGVTKSTISNIENGNRYASKTIIKLICKEYRVNYFWLTEESGDMFTNLPETLIDELVEEYNLDEFDKTIILEYLNLNKQHRDIIKTYLKNIIKKDLF